VTDWVAPPLPPIVVARTFPLLAESCQIAALRRYAEDSGAALVEADVAGACQSSDVIEALKAVLPFPSWCGASWDSVDDAFAELSEAWRFPLILVLNGFDQVFTGHQHLSLETAIRLHELEQAFSAASKQFLVVYEGKSWT
jgi:hypothetical protein